MALGGAGGRWWECAQGEGRGEGSIAGSIDGGLLVVMLFWSLLYVKSCFQVHSLPTVYILYSMCWLKALSSFFYCMFFCSDAHILLQFQCQVCGIGNAMSSHKRPLLILFIHPL